MTMDRYTILGLAVVGASTLLASTGVIGGESAIALWVGLFVPSPMTKGGPR